MRSGEMTQVKTVIFDMDGLMFATEKVYYKANQKTADNLDMEYSFDVYSQFIGTGNKYYEETMRELYEDQELVEEFFIKSNKVLEYLLLNGQVDLKEGLIELLEYLKKENIPAVVASSTKRDLVDQLLDRLNVREYFKDVIGGDEVDRAKPHPAIFNKAFNKTGIQDKDEALILEDSKNGVLAADAAGIPVIMVPDMVEADEVVKEKTIVVLSDLNEVIDFIKEKNK